MISTHSKSRIITEVHALLAFVLAIALTLYIGHVTTLSQQSCVTTFNSLSYSYGCDDDWLEIFEVDYNYDAISADISIVDEDKSGFKCGQISMQIFQSIEKVLKIPRAIKIFILENCF